MELTRLLIAVTLLVGVALTVSTRAGLGLNRSVLSATARAAVQLAVVGLVIAVVFRTPQFAPLYLTVVLTAASITSGRRLGGSREAILRAGVAILAGATTAGVIVFTTGALAWQAENSVPFLAQLTGGAMTATTVAGQRFHDDLIQRWGEYEAGLSIGLSPVEATRSLGQQAAVRALAPILDQTRTVGLVTLPGAYVGLLLGGATPLQAGRLQLLVLIGLLAAQTVAATVITRLLAPPWSATRSNTVMPGNAQVAVGG